MNLPKVTTIIPSFNHAKYIEQAMQSVLDQEYPDIQLIVVDDGSSDDSHEVIRDFCERNPGVIAILNEENRGQSAVMNQAMLKATGEFIQLLPSDDWYLPQKTRLQVQKFMAGPPSLGVVYARGYRYFEDEDRMVEWGHAPTHRGNVLRPLIESGNFVYPVTPMFRKECFEKEPFDETYRAEGEAIYPRIARHFEFDFIEDFVAVMRDHSYNIGKDAAVMYREINRYYDRVFSDPSLPADLRALEPVVRARHHRTKGLQLIRDRGEPALGRSSLIEAIKYRPVLLLDPKVVGGIVLSFLAKDRTEKHAS